jgi:hypothetical protein
MNERDTMRWVWRGSALGALVIGWVFIAWQNHFHITAPVVFVCLGYLAVVATVYNLWRTGAAAVASSEDVGDSTWAKPAGALGELEREKRTLLKAIKEAEFDHEMGKLSQRDVDEMVRTYRARAIEVIKELDRIGGSAGDSAREQILREVRARIELDGKAGKPAGKAAKAAKKQAKAGPAVVPYGEARPAEASEAAAATLTEQQAAAAAPAGEAELAAPHGDNGAAKAAMEATAADNAGGETDDEVMDADSTTTVEARRSSSAKEATP